MNTIYNVRLPIVALVRGTSERDAIHRLHAALAAAGFDVYDDAEAGWDAFESEPLDNEEGVL